MLVAIAGLAFSAGLLWDQWQTGFASRTEDIVLSSNGASKLLPQEKLASLSLPSDQISRSSDLALVDGANLREHYRVQFEQYLLAHNYLAAVDTYQIYGNREDTRKSGLKDILMGHLDSLITSSSQDHFTELTERYLSVFYDDIDVLLSLAQFNRSTGFLAEAAAVHHLVKSYAYTNRDKIKVESAINQFISQVHSDLVAVDDLFGLINIYQQMDSLDLLRPIHRLDQAQIFIQIGNMAFARDILDELINEPSVSVAAEKIMRQHQQAFSPEFTNKIALKNDYSDQIVLARRGNQYLADLEIQGTAVALLIDTGASMTTLSQQAFQTLSINHNFDLLGQRMFNTANGIAKGNIYQVDSLTLGRFTLAGLQIAVLDFSMPDGVNGLLGMNILANFRFHIDQETQMLYLAERQ